MSTVRVIQNKQRLTKEGNAPLYITFYIGKRKTDASLQSICVRH